MVRSKIKETYSTVHNKNDKTLKSIKENSVIPSDCKQPNKPFSPEDNRTLTQKQQSLTWRETKRLRPNFKVPVDAKIGPQTARPSDTEAIRSPRNAVVNRTRNLR